MNILSLFDGISCGQLALQEANIPVENYFSSEVDKYPIQITQKNFPHTVQLGDITKIDAQHLKLLNTIGIDLIMGGPPCQDLSFAGKGKGLKQGTRSSLFFEFVRVLKALQPKYFLVENVRMKKENQDIISEHLGVEPKVFNSSKVSAQNRHRLYWFNWEVGELEDKGIILADILENGVTDREKSHCLDANYFKGGNLKSYFEKHRRQLVFTGGAFRGRYKVNGIRQDHKGLVAGKTQQELEIRIDGKTNTLTTVQKDNVIVNSKELTWRKLSVKECERLQTVPDNYTAHVSNTRRYQCLGNGWTVAVITHILKGIC